MLVIGSGPIVIARRVSSTTPGLVLEAARRGLAGQPRNPNPATIMTDPEFADHTYVEPITPAFVERVIAQQAEREQDRRPCWRPWWADQRTPRSRCTSGCWKSTAWNSSAPISTPSMARTGSGSRTRRQARWRIA